MNFTLPANVFSDFSNLTIISSATPAGITYDPATRSFSGTPTGGNSTTLITLTGTDGNGASNTTTFNFIVRTNAAPVFAPSPINDQMFNIDQTVAFLIAVNDPNVGDTTTTTAIDPPAFMTWTTPTFTNSSGLIVANAGTHSIAMKVCDNWGLCTEESFKLTINQKPYLNAPIADTTCI